MTVDVDSSNMILCNDVISAQSALDKKMYRLLAESCESQSERARSNALPVAP